MKNLWIPFICIMLLISCAKKTYTKLESRKSNESAILLNQTSDASLISIDKTMTIKTRDIDTSVVIGEKTLRGSIDGRKANKIYYENDDLRLDLTADPSGIVLATATSKVKPLHLRMKETTTSFNDITTRGDSRTATQLETSSKADSLNISEIKQTDPAPINAFFKKATITILALLILFGGVWYVFRKLKDG